MSLKPFTYPFPETRFFHTGLSVYKFKIRYGNSIRGEEIENKEVIIRELEDSVRVVLGNLDDLQPFATEHFIVFPYKSKWESVSHLKFKHGEVVLVPYPFVFILYVEMKWFPENLSPALGKEEPWEPGFPLKVLPEEKSPGTMMRKRRRAEGSSPPRTPGLDRARVGMSSQVPSKKKAPMKTRRNRERKSQQERQETPAFDSSDVREQGSECGDSQAGPLAPSPSPQRNSPPPPRAPAALRTTGFFGFLSTLFPFSYFFRRSSP